MTSIWGADAYLHVHNLVHSPLLRPFLLTEKENQGHYRQTLERRRFGMGRSNLPNFHPLPLPRVTLNSRRTGFLLPYYPVRMTCGQLTDDRNTQLLILHLTPRYPRHRNVPHLLSNWKLKRTRRNRALLLTPLCYCYHRHPLPRKMPSSHPRGTLRRIRAKLVEEV